MTEREKDLTLAIAHKTDVILWVLSIPLIPMIMAELFTVLSGEMRAYFDAYYAILWVIFTLEFILRLIVEKNRIEYLKTNWFDVLVVLTPMFKVLKVFNFMRFPVVFFSDRILSILSRFGMNFLYYLIFVAVVIIVSSNLVIVFESKSQVSTIRTFDDAAWWAVNTLSLSGAASLEPVTIGGRLVAMGLMTLGFAIFSVFITSTMSFFMKGRKNEKPEDSDLLSGIGDQIGIDEVLARLDRIEKKLDRE